jgi:hypothetical protein
MGLDIANVFDSIFPVKYFRQASREFVTKLTHLKFDNGWISTHLDSV